MSDGQPRTAAPPSLPAHGTSRPNGTSPRRQSSNTSSDASSPLSQDTQDIEEDTISATTQTHTHANTPHVAPAIVAAPLTGPSAAGKPESSPSGSTYNGTKITLRRSKSLKATPAMPAPQQASAGGSPPRRGPGRPRRSDKTFSYREDSDDDMLEGNASAPRPLTASTSSNGTARVVEHHGRDGGAAQRTRNAGEAPTSAPGSSNVPSTADAAQSSAVASHHRAHSSGSQTHAEPSVNSKKFYATPSKSGRDMDATGAVATPQSANRASKEVSSAVSKASPASASAPNTASAASLRHRPRKVVATFVSSRTFAPLSDGEDDKADAKSQPPKEGGMKRMDKKSAQASKSDEAFDADTNMSRVSSSSMVLDIPPKASPALHPTRKAQQISPSAPLPLEGKLAPAQGQVGAASIPTYVSTPRRPPPRKRPRLFGLEECPTFYPTWEEFADPMKYIEHIGSPQGGNGKEYGIVKISPPEGWHPDCVLDQQRFRFRTRVQQLNSLSADARATINYQEQLQKYHSQQGRARVSIPVIDRRPVDLYQLKLAVKDHGGFDSVQKGRKWADLTRALGYADKDAAHLATQVKAAFVKIIQPFELFLARARDQAKQQASPSAAMRQSTGTPTLEEASSAKHSEPTTAWGKEMLASGTALEEVLQAEADAIAGGKRRSARRRTETRTLASQADLGASHGTRRRRHRNDSPTRDGASDNLITVDGAEEQMCEICLRGDDGMAMLLCDECNRGYHMYCLDPPLATVPKSQWFCPPCLVGTGNDYGFDDGETHSLDSFWKRAELFRRKWFEERPEALWKPTGSEDETFPDAASVSAPDVKSGGPQSPNGVVRPLAHTALSVSEDDVEREFWRLVQSPDETVEVEYGADVHSTTHGSALPTLETHPLNPYARDGWNLNNLPILPASLLRYIKSDISGMTVPWVYVGMMFSTFCWHNEDHYTYSINYQHFGDTKTWYGIPGGDAEKFEEAMRRAAPDLFETSPDLLFQLVTMMSPEKLRKEGVRVFACDQRANEIVITYPKAYHSGFNHGFNLNEAVNFALPDWIGLDLECVQRYQRFLKPPVFSHDELIVTASQHSTSIDTASWLQHPFREMTDRELAARASLRDDVPGLTEVLQEGDAAESEYQCAHCNCFCYLSQVTSPKAEGVSCLDHVFKVCGADSPTNWTLRLRYTDDQLQAALQKLTDRADQPIQWQQRFRKLLTTHARPPLRNLRGLLQEGERISVKLEELEQLRDFVDKANDWVAQATRLMPKRYGGRPNGSQTGRSKTSLLRQDENGLSEAESDQERTPEAIRALLEEVELLPFDAPEIGSLREALATIEDISLSCANILQRIDAGSDVPLVECDDVLAAGAGYNVEPPEYRRLQKHVAGKKWLAEMDDIQDNHISLSEVQELLDEFKEADLPVSHAHHIDLQQRLRDGMQWQTEATSLLEDGKVILCSELERLTTTPNRIPVVPELQVRLEKLLSQGREWQKGVSSLLQATAGGNGTLDQLQDARKVLRSIQSSKVDVTGAHDLDAAVQLYDEWQDLLMQSIVTAVEGEATEDLSAESVSETISRFSRRVKQCFELPADASPESLHNEQGARSRQCLERVPDEDMPESSVQCAQCKVRFHPDCILPDDDEESASKAIRGRSSQAQTAQVPLVKAGWKCPLCSPAELPQLLEKRRAVQLGLVKQLVQMPRFALTSLRFKPAEYDHISQAVLSSERMLRVAQAFLDPKPDVFTPDNAEKYRNLLMRLLGSPIDLELPQSSTAIHFCVQALFRLHRLDATGKATYGATVAPSNSQPTADSMPAPEPLPTNDFAFDMHDDQPPPMAAAPTSAAATAQPAAEAGLKRKRGKRAKLVFREEIGIWVPVNGERIYCLCHQKETGTMISCDRCMLWFHNSCVHVGDPKSMGDAKWHCPMCCVKTERKYPHAEVKVKDMGVTDPDLWLDIRASLRSNSRPISKMQYWSVPEERRIVLHLDSFYPAIAAEQAGPVPGEGSAKRFKPDTSYGSAAVPTGPAPRTVAIPPAAVAMQNSMQANLAYPPTHVPEPVMVPVRHVSGPLGSQASQPIVLDSDEELTASSRPQVSSVAIPSTARRPLAGRPTEPVGPGASSAADEATRIARERHRAGMANLYARGVTDAMIQKFFVGWNGRTLVYPRYDVNGHLMEIDLGPRIRLEEDDVDGTMLITSILKRRLREGEMTQAMPQSNDWRADAAPPLPPTVRPRPYEVGQEYGYAQPGQGGPHRDMAMGAPHHDPGQQWRYGYKYSSASPSYVQYEPRSGGARSSAMPTVAAPHPHARPQPVVSYATPDHMGGGAKPMAPSSQPAAPTHLSPHISPAGLQRQLPPTQSLSPSQAPQRPQGSYGEWPEPGMHMRPPPHASMAQQGIAAAPRARQVPYTGGSPVDFHGRSLPALGSGSGPGPSPTLSRSHLHGPSTASHPRASSPRQYAYPSHEQEPAHSGAATGQGPPHLQQSYLHRPQAPGSSTHMSPAATPAPGSVPSGPLPADTGRNVGPATGERA
ncbi:unnamed protein product [Parajaminaea phylloscopi]